ncbi:hypothetical protein FOCG_14602 [Fusarium oxysporum f. sp. radicis-lycopersici 26381]|uniref:Uncharacterized protein n=3 Tax=Fusarium oxysporum TaxID=5507 RepID=A0A0J9VR17_FUSO4|nr:hypothetical protein FOXG_20789 [Fusarium oxysporum f. sp. lycopersici 4287]XP_018251297.1 hypothetical protein FOXG_20789 [Fusarium oxysporum f. sp. lycopersici 4287]EWZ31799.1 hypothetical protein FOZG_14882 [Fusarium oxysporum Fo47]EWZ94388.1 hypothetical protein FOWG_04708 [Fusarium oxysporum f. sp. lycopersici MN25]EXK38171.1 hypothetical protein FOMG_08616 [Fusarium oxysporum f. sp. melonis 26406]EXL43080.1 hypothetical protein FOCG_14602 [Fusarium oxysporum f. sp. radicis-lycopersici
MIIQSIYLSPTPLQSPEATPLTALLSTIINTRIKVLRRNAPASVTLQCYIATVRPPGPCAKWQGARILCYTIPYVYLFLFATDRCVSTWGIFTKHARETRGPFYYQDIQRSRSWTMHAKSCLHAVAAMT